MSSERRSNFAVQLPNAKERVDDDVRLAAVDGERVVNVGDGAALFHVALHGPLGVALERAGIADLKDEKHW